VLGITIKRSNKEWKMYLADMTSLQYDLMRSGWIGDYNDPNTFFDMFVKDGGNNRTGWTNPQYDAWLKESQAEQDHDKRMHIFQKMERMLIEEEFPIMPLYIYVYQGMLKESVMGFEHNIRDLHPFQYMWMEE
jgi:oligopeptide transport system substrate-binding protein